MTETRDRREEFNLQASRQQSRFMAKQPTRDDKQGKQASNVPPLSSPEEFLAAESVEKVNLRVLKKQANWKTKRYVMLLLPCFCCLSFSLSLSLTLFLPLILTGKRRKRINF